MYGYEYNLIGDIMKRSLKLWQIVGFIFTCVTGVLLHFLYDWTNQSIIIAPFSAVNESIWEHMKLLFFPMFVFALIEYKFVGKQYKTFWSTKFAGTIIALILIPILYYTYTGILGVNADWFNIVIFFISAGAAYYFENLLFKNRIKFSKSSVAFLSLCLILILFIVMTFIQPKIPLFQDPATLKYGIYYMALGG